MTGYQAVIGILAALHAREQRGQGQHVEVDMLSVVMDCQLQELVTYLNSGRMPRRTEERSAHGSIPAPYGIYRTSDSWLTLAMVPLNILGEVLDDDWLRTLTHYDDGHQHRDEVYRRIRHSFEGKTTAEWIEICDRHGAWCGPVLDYDGLVKDPHVVDQDYIVEQPQMRGRAAKTVRPPLKLSETPTGIRRGAPALGEHSKEILSDVLRYAPEQIEELIVAGAVGAVGDAHVEERS